VSTTAGGKSSSGAPGEQTGGTTSRTRGPAQELNAIGAVRILQEAVREGVSVDALSNLAQGDPGFALRVLSLVNSPAMGRTQRVTNITQAATLLGVRGLRNVALSLVVGDLAPAGPEGGLLLTVCLRRAVAAQALAPAFQLSDTDLCFTTGLLLDVGILLRARESLDSALMLVRLPAEHRVVQEQVHDLELHPTAGANVIAKYGLPQEMSAAILAHHDVAMPGTKLSKVAWFAERVAGVFETPAAGQAREALLSHARSVGLGAQFIDDLLEALPKRVEQMAEAFAREVGAQASIEQLRSDANARLVELNQQYEEMILTLRRVLAEKETLARRLEEANQNLALQASTDALTGVNNRRALEQTLQRDLRRAERAKEPLSLLLIDIDHFKQVNDRHGHLVGDAVLCRLAAILTRAVRDGDFVARYGGEEFCLILPQSSADGALLAARRVRVAIERAKVSANGAELSVTASFGAVTYTPGLEHLTPAQLVARADKSLYEAKHRGRNCVVHFDEFKAAAQ
jgi:diguanylate cyclase (GGDEF)-like protein